MSNFKDKLISALAPHDPKIVVYEKGSKHPPYSDLDVTESFLRFEAEMLPLSPLTDPRDKKIQIIENNFPKFLNLEPKKQGDPARPIVLVRALKAGTFNPDKYNWERDRIRDLFWVPEVVTQPDGIYKNAHCVIAADEVYVKVYEKLGSTVKLVFTKDVTPHHTVIVTSYLTTPVRAIDCLRELVWPVE